MKIIKILLLFLALPGFLFAQENALFLQRTIDETPELNTAPERDGQAMVYEVPAAFKDELSIAFWAKVIDDPLGPNYGGTTFLTTTKSNIGDGSGIGYVWDSHIPAGAKYEWHYFHYRISLVADAGGGPAGGGQVHRAEIFVDGNPTPVETRTLTLDSGTAGRLDLDFLFFGRFQLGVNESNVGGAEPNNRDLLLDDITIWDGASQAVTDQINRIYRFGINSVLLPSRPAELVVAVTNESGGDTLPVLKDDRINYLGSNITLYSMETDAGGPVLQLVTDKPNVFVPITVESNYGPTRVSPSAGSLDVPKNGSRDFSAPEFIYLDRYKNELDPTPDNIKNHAYYRARNVGYAIEGGSGSVQGTERFFTYEVTESITVKWQWELEYAVIIEMATGNLDDLSDALGNPVTNVGEDAVNGLGKKWTSGNTLVSSLIDGVIVAEGNAGSTAGPFRFASKGLVIENAPEASSSTSGNYITFSGEKTDEPLFGPYLFSAATNVNLQDKDFTIEFWARKDPGSTGSDQTIMTIGAKPAFIVIYYYFQVGFDEVDGALFYTGPDGFKRTIDPEYTDNDWHHWTFSYDQTSSILTIYRDGLEVFSRSETFPFDADINPWLTLGSLNPFGVYNSFHGAVDNLRIWNEVRSEAQLEESRSVLAYGNGGGTNLTLELTFDGWDELPDLTSLPSTDGSATLFAYRNENNLFTRGLNQAERIAAILPEISREVRSSSSRLRTDDYVVQDWLRVTWEWEKQFKIKFSADSVYSGLPKSDVIGMPYIEGDAVLDPNGDYWANEFAAITIGTQYRTADRCATLSGPSGQLYGFRNITSATLLDGTRNGVATREFTIDPLTSGGEITWLYDRTVYRAQVPLGSGLDVSKDLVVDAEGQLTPNLCVGGALRLNATPVPVLVTDKPNASGENGPNPFQWDQVSSLILPLQPGTIRVEWPDANEPGVSHLIELVSDFPQDTLTMNRSQEDDSGYQLDAAGSRIVGTANTPSFDALMPGVSDAFPASPGAHYRHLYSSDDRQTPPVAIDGNPSDRWKFKERGYTESRSSIDEEGIFSATQDGKSVLLYSYRPDANEVANGDTTREAFAARVVASESLETRTQDDRMLAGSNGNVMKFGENFTDIPLYLNNGVATFAGDRANTMEFWIKKDAEYPGGWPESWDTVIYNQISTLGTPVAGIEAGALIDFRIGFRSPVHPTNPNGFFIDTRNASNTSQGIDTVDLSQIQEDFEWHHWAVVFDLGSQRIYRDGMLVYENETRGFPFDVVELLASYSFFGSFRFYGQGFSLLANPVGLIDNLRIWSSALSAANLRESMRTSAAEGTATLSFGSPATNVTFDETDNNSVLHNGTTGVQFLSNGDLSQLIQPAGYDGPSEVATRVRSKLDRAGYGSGYIANEVSNYNAGIYTRGETVGNWGPIFLTNWGEVGGDLYVPVVAYYENPYLAMPTSNDVLHPNVAWPYVAVSHPEVLFPEVGEHKDKRIYISSRIGSEGVDVTGDDQRVFDPTLYTDLAVYNQPDLSLPGYNPNEEHALIAPSIKASLTGDNAFNLGQKAAFALQKDLNVWGQNDSDTATTNNNAATFTSEPWVLVQYKVAETDEWEMAAYRVEDVRDGTGELFPAVDPLTHLPSASVVQPTDPTYDFEYISFAGDIVIPPYPLNLVVGNLVVDNTEHGNISNEFWIRQRTIWKDKNGNPWVVSGDGRYFSKHWYPLRADFWLDRDLDGVSDVNGSAPIAWLSANGQFTEAAADPVAAKFVSHWRNDYPVLKKGETLTYQGGEYAAQTAGAQGLPGVVNWASSELVFDSETPDMTISLADYKKYTARITRPLDRIVFPFEQSDFPAELNPANTDKIYVDGPRWYFKDLAGSLQKQFYYDSLLGQLVFRGRLADKESGDPDLSQTPISLYILEPNVLSLSDKDALLELDAGSATPLDLAIVEIYKQTQNRNALSGVSITENTEEFLSGLQPLYNIFADGYQPIFFREEDPNGSSPGTTLTESAPPFNVAVYEHLSSLGTGAALVANPDLLSKNIETPQYVTLCENNHPAVSGAVSLHVIRLSNDRYRGAIKVVEAKDVFDEKINLRHNGDFGGNVKDIYYQWWIRDVDNLDVIGIPGDGVDLGWQKYTEGLGLNKIAFTGRPDIVLADKLFYVRYAERNELDDITGESNTITSDPDTASVTEDSWRLVGFSDDIYTRLAGEPVPYQWAGASNSPQPQADGSKRFIPQLVMGWVKRVLDRVNPYEARYSDFYNNESPATYSSQLQIAGAPYIGNVALNSDKNVIENVGLIELYRTVLDRAKSLTLDIPGAPTAGTNQALLLAATRLAFMYELLAGEAYHDFQNPVITVDQDFWVNVPTVAPYVHAFYNQEGSLLHEELALLRGTDFVKAYPAYNRLFWNYVKGEGEAAYNVNYNVYDENEDGFINEFDAARLYPQGHGDAWGHYLSALGMHYELLRSSAFDWSARSELYSLLDNVIEVDYLDEQSFARIAAEKARAGLDIIRSTYRLAYTEDPSGQWQGYSDVDSARSWGVSDWAKRSGQGALFDWVTAQAVVPADADLANGREVEGLDQIDRRANLLNIREIARTQGMIQQAMDGANSGLNPLGLDRDAVNFDLDPIEYETQGNTHFEQVYERAVTAAQNALVTLENAGKSENQIRRIANDTRAIQVGALRQDIEYRNRLIDLFGTPYSGKIGPGQPFAEGYDGPDSLLYLFIDEVDSADLTPPVSDAYTLSVAGEIQSLRTDDTANPEFNTLFDLTFDGSVETRFDNFKLDGFGAPLGISDLVTVNLTSDYAFQVPDGEDWGKRASNGKIQLLLNEILLEEIALKQKVVDYDDFINQAILLVAKLDGFLRIEEARDAVGLNSKATITSLRIANELAKKKLVGLKEAKANLVGATRTSITFLPKVVGLATDATSGVRGGLETSKLIAQTSLSGVEKLFEFLIILNDGVIEGLKGAKITDGIDLDRLTILESIATELSTHLTKEESKRIAIAQHVQSLRLKQAEFQSALAEGFRLLDERESFNMVLASKVQRNRYSDMVRRLSRNEALAKYQSAYENALKYTWLAAKAYDYETSLDPGDPAAVTSVLEDLVRTRNLGLWSNGTPQVGEGGLGEILAQLKGNFDVLEGQLGINNPQMETGKISLRKELFRIKDETKSEPRWQQALRSEYVPDLRTVPEYRQYCRPIATDGDAEQPGLVLEFSSEINTGKNFFGRILGGGDHAYSSSSYATKIRSVGVWFEGYNDAQLATAPRVYLVPAGADVLRISNSSESTIRNWNVIEQKIPAPFVINDTNLNSLSYLPATDSLNGSFADIRRFADFRAYHAGETAGTDPAQMVSDSRLIGRSVANTRWLLIIPGNTFHADPEHGLTKFIESVSDIQIQFETYSHSGD